MWVFQAVVPDGRRMGQRIPLCPQAEDKTVTVGWPFFHYLFSTFVNSMPIIEDDHLEIVYCW